MTGQGGRGRAIVRFLATGFGAGRIPFAPGTFGTLVAVPLYLALREAGWPAYLFATAVIFAVGIWLCGRAERDLGSQDASEIVWDEIAGFLISMFAAPAGWVWTVAGFAVFRLFDIVKPFPIGLLDRRIHGGFGVMADDAVAGFYTLAVLQVVSLFL